MGTAHEEATDVLAEFAAPVCAGAQSAPATTWPGFSGRVQPMAAGIGRAGNRIARISAAGGHSHACTTAADTHSVAPATEPTVTQRDRHTACRYRPATTTAICTAGTSRPCSAAHDSQSSRRSGSIARNGAPSSPAARRSASTIGRSTSSNQPSSSDCSPRTTSS